jgi:hypothetical protein
MTDEPGSKAESSRRDQQAKLESAFAEFSVKDLTITEVVALVQSLPKKQPAAKPTAVPAQLGLRFRDQMSEYFDWLKGRRFRVTKRSQPAGIEQTIEGYLVGLQFVGNIWSEYSYIVLATKLEQTADIGYFRVANSESIPFSQISNLVYTRSRSILIISS